MSLCECGCGAATPIARKTQRDRGQVKGHPLRFIVGHNNVLRRQTYTVEDRGHETPCWIWNGGTNAEGYARGSRGRAYRTMYERIVGPVPDGLELDHLCRVRACVNPEHLEPVTHQENMRRAGAVRWASPDGLPLAIREARDVLGLSQSQLAARLGVSQSLVHLLETGKHQASPDAIAGVIRELTRALRRDLAENPSRGALIS